MTVLSLKPHRNQPLRCSITNHPPSPARATLRPRHLRAPHAHRDRRSRTFDAKPNSPDLSSGRRSACACREKVTITSADGAPGILHCSKTGSDYREYCVPAQQASAYSRFLSKKKAQPRRAALRFHQRRRFWRMCRYSREHPTRSYYAAGKSRTQAFLAALQ